MLKKSENSGNQVSKVAAFLFISTILVSPIPFGAVHDWAWALTAVAIGVTAAAFVLSRDMTRFVIEWRGRLCLPLLGFVAVLAWIMFQLQHPQKSISLNPDATLDGLVRLMMYGLVFLLAVAFGRGRQFANSSMRLFALSGLIIALYAIISWQFAPNWLLWKQKEYYHGSATGTFVNRNTFATYAGLVLLTITAIILTQKTQAARYRPGHGRVRWFVSYFVLHLERNWFWILAWITVLFALLLSGSRAGTLSTVVGMVGLVLLVHRFEADGIQSGHTVMRKLKALMIVVLGMLAVYFAGGNNLTARILDGDIGAQADERLAIYELTLRAIYDAFWTGTGLGAFPQIFEIYRTTHPGLQPGSEFVHNTFLEVTAGLGVPAALVFYAVLAHCAYQCFRGVRRRHLGRVYPALGAAATILAGVHSLVDFSLEIPAVAITYAFLLGLGFSQAWRQIQSEAKHHR